MADSVSVLVVEDEEDIRNLVALNLRRSGFDVLTAGDGKTALALARQHVPPVVLLDLMLPDMSGTEICQALRDDSTTRSVYVIMVTARTEESDRITGFEVGADDYVPKPFSVKELVLRVQAAARRMARIEPVPVEAASLELGELRLDISAHRVWVSGEELELTSTEYKLLLHLAESAGRLCSRGELLKEVWELPPSLNTRTVDTHVKRLRQKLRAASSYIETVRGAGYRFRSFDS
jgi:two-component system phosphate regulon response regulator PhoB